MNASPELYRRHRLSVDDYHRMGESGIFAPDARVELIEGEIIDMAPIGNDHLGTVDRLTRLLVMATGEKCIVRVQGSVRLTDFSEPEPDLLLLRPRDDFYTNSAAGPDDVLLLIEVSKTSLRYDLEVKTPLYAKTGVPEVWVIDLNSSRLRRFIDPGDGEWQIEDSPDSLTALSPSRVSGVTVDLSSLF